MVTSTNINLCDQESEATNPQEKIKTENGFGVFAYKNDSRLKRTVA